MSALVLDYGSYVEGVVRNAPKLGFKDTADGHCYDLYEASLYYSDRDFFNRPQLHTASIKLALPSDGAWVLRKGTAFTGKVERATIKCVWTKTAFEATNESFVWLDDFKVTKGVPRNLQVPAPRSLQERIANLLPTALKTAGAIFGLG
jgi:hypothetical protein